MTEGRTDVRRGEAGSRFRQLEADASGSGEEKARLDRHLDALEEAIASAGAAAGEAEGGLKYTLGQLGTRLAIAQHRLAGTVAEDRGDFERAVEAELDAWDTYLERLQTRAATQTGSARAAAEAHIAELRSCRSDVAERLGDMLAAPLDVWLEYKERVLQALDELDRKAAER